MAEEWRPLAADLATGPVKKDGGRVEASVGRTAC